MQRLTSLSRGKKILATLLGVGILLIITLIALRVAYFGRIYPGVTANGVYLGGLNASEATKELAAQTSKYSNQPIEVIMPQQKISLSANQVGVVYDNSAAVSEAFTVGRQGWPIDRLISQFVGLIGQSPDIVKVNYDPERISTTLVDINTKIASPVENAKFVNNDGNITIQESQRGRRVDFALSPKAFSNHFGQLNTKLMVTPVLYTDPQLSSQTLDKQKDIISPFIKQPLVLSYESKNWPVELNTIIGWLTLPSSNQPISHNLLSNYYHLSSSADQPIVFYDRRAVSQFIASLAKDINVAPIDAQLTISGEKATVFTQSRDGKTLDVEKSTDAVMKQLASASTTPVPLAVTTTKADVSDDNIEKLGIKELISEGVTYFPNSPPNRMQNIRIGASKFNGVLVKPGEVFSFNENLGEVSGATGYTQGLVILGDHEEKQYGGGLCQVSSTAYRAALLAGLPILARTNHAFAVSYYTQPYGIPGVDATIYLPGVDMQFRNDTGHHILIQTILSGTTLRFRFYGTKVKSGVIRGPQFVYGSLDATAPSQTVFWRDVVDLNGKVIKTDEINTYYKSSLDFPITD